jgi:hypothetical protein
LQAVAPKENFKMNKGVEILLERMKSNPEEFVPEYDGGTTKWGMVIGHFQAYLSKEDKETLDTAWKETVVTAMQEKFTQAVMKELLDPKSLELEDVIKQYRATGISSVGQTLASSLATSKAMSMGATLSASGNLTTNSITLGNQTLDESTIAHMKLHAEYMKAQIQAEKTKAKRWWNKSIPELFGKK